MSCWAFDVLRNRSSFERLQFYTDASQPRKVSFTGIFHGGFVILFTK